MTDIDIDAALADDEFDANGIHLDESGGGIRRNKIGSRFELTYEQLVEFEAANDRIAADAEFWAWFAGYIHDNKLTPMAPAYRRGSIEETWKGGGFDDTKSWWAKKLSGEISWFGKGKGESDDAVKLAVILQAVRTPIRVIDQTVPPMTVRWSTSDISYTDFRTHAIHVNGEPALNADLTDVERANICTGLAMHEASHSQETRGVKDEALGLTPPKLAMWLLNVLEDCRIEARTTDRYPGFASYFQDALDYYWDKSIRDLFPKEYGPKLTQKMNVGLAIIRWQRKLADLDMSHPSFSGETEWWTAWRDSYLDGSVKARDAVVAGIAHLKPEEEEEGGGEKGEEGEGKGPESDVDAAAPSCVSHMGVDKGYASLGDVEAAERLADEEFHIDEVTIKESRRGADMKVNVSRPLLDEEARREFIGKPSGILARLRAALLFRQELPAYAMRLEKEGAIDDDELYRFGMGDYRVFRKDVIAQHPKVQMTLLIDMSGSMSGRVPTATGSRLSKLTIAQELAQLFIAALEAMPTVETRVFGHTGDVRDDDTEIYDLWRAGDPHERLGLISSLEHIQNYDGYAIEWCAKEILDRGDEDEQRVIIVMADGWPEGTGYGGARAQEHVRKVVEWADKKRIKVIQIAIDAGMDGERQSRMFREYIPFKDFETLPRQLGKLLAKLT